MKNNGDINIMKSDIYLTERYVSYKVAAPQGANCASLATRNVC